MPLRTHPMTRAGPRIGMEKGPPEGDPYHPWSRINLLNQNRKFRPTLIL